MRVDCDRILPVRVVQCAQQFAVCSGIFGIQLDRIAQRRNRGIDSSLFEQYRAEQVVEGGMVRVIPQSISTAAFRVVVAGEYFLQHAQLFPCLNVFAVQPDGGTITFSGAIEVTGHCKNFTQQDVALGCSRQ